MTKRDAWLDASEQPPTEPGWYAVLWCYEPNEGFFPDGAYWDGERWLSDVEQRLPTPPIALRSPQPFTEEEDAMDWAQEHDPEACWRGKGLSTGLHLRRFGAGLR